MPQVTKSFFHGLNLDVVGPRWEVRPDTNDVYSKEFILGNPEVPSSGFVRCLTDYVSGRRSFSTSLRRNDFKSFLFHKGN